MGIDRRNFLRIVGATGVGAMLPNMVKGEQSFINENQS